MSVTIQNALREATETLTLKGIAEPRLDALTLLKHVTGYDRTLIVAHPEWVVGPEQLAVFRTLVARRASREPLQHITGFQEFYKLDFQVSPQVLIPRPETEVIVEAAIESFGSHASLHFADIGTGSGCIAISLLHELPQSRAVATDVSPAALQVVQRNADRHHVSSRLRLIESDLFAGLDPSFQFDLIVSNPPYVPAEEMHTLQPEVQHEPRAALDGGPGGLLIVDRLLRDARSFLKKGGFLIFEIGFDQVESVKQLIDDTVWEILAVRKDLQGIPRTVVLKKKT